MYYILGLKYGYWDHMFITGHMAARRHTHTHAQESVDHAVTCYNSMIAPYYTVHQPLISSLYPPTPAPLVMRSACVYVG